MLRRCQTGASLLEMMVAGSLGLLVVLAVQQAWAWQLGQQLGSGESTKAFLTAQSLIEQIAQDAANANPDAIALSGRCYLLPQHDGRLLAYRVKNRQVQRHTLAPHCPERGWQSLSHYHDIAVDELLMQLTTTAAAPLLELALTAKSPRDDSYHAFNREVVLHVAR